MHFKKLFSKGFTLVEVMVAITIMAFMTLGIYSLLDSGQQTRDTVISEDRDYLQAYTALFRLKSDIEQLWSPLYYSSTKLKSQKESQAYNTENQEGKNAPISSQLFPKASVKGHPTPLIENEDKSTLAFFTTSNRRKMQDQKESRFAWVHYSLENEETPAADTSSAGLSQLVRRFKAHDPYAGDVDLTQIRGHVLMRGIKSLAFEFWDPEKKKWQERLKDLPNLDQMAPRGIKIVIEWQDLSQQEYVHVRVYRPNWPYFDVIKDEKIKQKALKKKTSPTPQGKSNVN